MKKLVLVCMVLLLCLSSAANAAEYSLINNTLSLADIYDIGFSPRKLNLGEKTYISADDALKAAGYELGWEPNDRAIIVYDPLTAETRYIYIHDNKIWNGIRFIYYNGAVAIKDDAAYISEEMLNDIMKPGFSQNIYPQNKDVLSIEDGYRLSGNVDCYNGIYLLNGWYAFEMIDITNEGALDYAEAVNAVAAAVPKHVNVYNMLIPNSAVFYAPKGYAGNILSQYEKIYENLDTRVTPVDIYPSLLLHADDFIYFNTDHHWTHRGAYYAFEEFMRQKGKTVNYLDYFPQNNTKNVVGSFAGLMNGTMGATLINNYGETLERFIPPYTITKDVYNDCALQKHVATGPLINDNIKTYSTFIGGDVPVTKIHNKDLSNGLTLCIIKDSYANAFSTWAAANYEYVYLVDIRCFNGANGYTEEFDINDFYNVTGFDDLLIMSYPNTVADSVLRYYIRSFS